MVHSKSQSRVWKPTSNRDLSLEKSFRKTKESNNDEINYLTDNSALGNS